MQYQSFPGVKGGSASLQKLTALRLPPLTGKRFLDVGCNEGFFCGYALFEGASQVLGMDKSSDAIAKAKVRFPNAEFVNQSWDALPEGPFDVITLLSALHYAEDQEALIHQLMNLLADDGLLVLEIGIAPNQKKDWIKIKRAIDECWFPTRNKLGHILKDYAWKIIGHSVTQTGDPLPRYVVHVRKLRPYVWLLMQEPGSGKSTISRRMFATNPNLKVISGDRIYYQINQGQLDVSEQLRALIQEDYSSTTIDKTTRKVLEQGFSHELVKIWSTQAGFNDFSLDSYVPTEFRQNIKNSFQDIGYFPMEVTWNNHTPLTSAQAAREKAKQYTKNLEQNQKTLNCNCAWVEKIITKKLKPFIKWHFDSPKNGEVITDPETVRVSGWAVTKGHLQSSYQLYAVAPQEETRLFSPNKERADVLESLFGETEIVPDLWQKTPCGFHFNLPASWLKKGVEVGLLINGDRIPLAKLTLSPPQTTSLTGQLVKSLKLLRA